MFNKDEVKTVKMKDDQIKMISKHPVQLIPFFGTEKERKVSKRIMVICRLQKSLLDNEQICVQVK